nr:MAG TPA: hypothetical protein [Caudoviricetes sp.]
MRAIRSQRIWRHVQMVQRLGICFIGRNQNIFFFI